MRLLAILVIILLVSANAMIYDFVIIGSGPAGSMCAHMLAKDPRMRILILEQGDDISNLTNHVVGSYGTVNYGVRPGEARYWSGKSPFSRHLFSSEESGAGYYHPAAMAAGGGSAINGGVSQFFTCEDLRRFNSTRWTCESTLNIRKKMEACRGSRCDPQQHGTDGPITFNTFEATGVQAVLQNASEMIFAVPLHNDLMSASVDTGIGMVLRAVEILPSGEPLRQNIWYKTARTNPRVKTIFRAKVIKIQVNPHGFHLVEYLSAEGIIQYAFSTKEVIMAAGALADPAILELSGIGDCARLRTMGIKCVHDNPEVGKNLHNSIVNNMIFFTTVASPTTNGAVTGVYVPSQSWKMRNETGSDMNLQYSFFTGGGMVLASMNYVRHNQTGRVEIHSDNPHVDPHIQFNLHRVDLQPMVELYRKTYKLFTSTGGPFFPMASLGTPPTDLSTDAAIIDWLKKTNVGQYHAQGSCAMHKVVDDKLRLINGRGEVIKNIRIVGNSVLPYPPAAQSMMTGSAFVGAVGAHIIANDWGLSI